ncbi:MAG: putative glutathione S-transferase-like protein [Myxococcaceae bacterium]|nr:putative glutathione S-transferase-like protein [Myxococcaceae bacterium]
MIKLYGHPMSTCTRKVLMTLAETSTPHELVLVDFAKAEHKQPAHLARQPFGQLPALEDDGFAMYESRAMARYVAEKANSPLMPKGLRERAKVEQWLSVESANFTPHAMKFVYHHIMKREQDATVLETAATGLGRALDVMESQLATTTFIAGEDLSIADIAFMPYLEYVWATPAKEQITAHPRVTAWWNRISERPTWRTIAGR